jgi:hypothetical protein
VDRLRKTLVLVALVATPVAAHSMFATTDNLCFASGASTYKLSPKASSPDFRVRFDNGAAQPDLRIRLVDSAEIADFALADDFSGADSSPCQPSTPIKTIAIDRDGNDPAIVVAMAAEMTHPDYRIYVHSARYSHQDVAALMAAMWKARQRRELAARVDR